MAKVKTAKRKSAVTWTGTRVSDGGVEGITGYVGQPGCGKTFRAGRTVARCTRCVAFNTVASYGDPTPRNPGRTRMPGFVEIVGVRKFIEYLRTKRHGNFRIIFTPDTAKPEVEFNQVCELIWHVGNTVFLVDEIWYFQKPGWSPDWLKRMMLTGRHHGITLLWTAQRPQCVDKSLIATTQTYYFGRMQSERDIAAFRYVISAEDAGRISSLPDRQFIHRRSTGETELVK